MNINYEFIKKGKRALNGSLYVYSPSLFISIKYDFSITIMELDGKNHRSIVFGKPDKSVYEDGLIRFREKLSKEISDDKLIILCSYPDNIHPIQLEKVIKNDISKRLMEYTKTKI